MKDEKVQKAPLRSILRGANINPAPTYPKPQLAPQCTEREPVAYKDWGIDNSCGRPILVFKGCSVIEGEDAEYILSLIKADQAKLTTPPQRKPLTHERDHAICDANFYAESEAFFKARPQLDTPENRRVFYAGHRRAWLSKDCLIEDLHNIKDKQ